MKPLGLRAIQGNEMQADARAFWKVPRARVHNTPGNPSYGAGVGFVSWDTVDYDTDAMTTVTGTAWAPNFSLVCRTKGTYWVASRSEWQWQAGNFAGLVNIWPRIIINGNPAAYLAGETDVNDVSQFGRWFDIGGLWHASVGDCVSMYHSTSQAITLAGGTYGLWLSANWVSSYF